MKAFALPCRDLRYSLHYANKPMECASWTSVSTILNEHLRHKVSEAGDISLQAMLQPSARRVQ